MKFRFLHKALLILGMTIFLGACDNSEGSSTESGQLEEPTRNETEAKSLIDGLHARLMKGENFATLANEYSEDPGSNTLGGQYEHVTLGMMVPEFDKVTFELGLNEISQPFLTEFGYHIVTVTAIRENERDVRHILIRFK
jgi:parvulin-like peptidyl-prolyl isomerase